MNTIISFIAFNKVSFIFFFEMDSFNPLDVLREEMENEEISLRVNAVHRMRVVATLLPADKLKS